MKHYKLQSAFLLTSILTFLTACGDTEEPTSSEPVLDAEETHEETGAEAEESDESEGVAEDQLELKMGDTATVDTTIGTYEITLNNLELKEEVEGEISEIDLFLIADYTLKNLGEETINTIESINVLEATDLLEGPGEPDVSVGFETIAGFEDIDLATGEEAVGQAIYNSYDADTFYIRVVQGLVASGGVKNDVRFTVEKSEIN